MVVKVFACAWMIALTFSSFANAQTRISVESNVQVSIKNNDRAHYEVRITADPANPQRLVACTMVHSSKENNVHSIVYASSDGGKSWNPTLETDSEMDPDPDCTFGLDGAGYFSTINKIYRSEDGGRTWQEPYELPKAIDRPYLTVDRASVKYRGRIYLHGLGNPFNSFNFLRSLDRGMTFQPRIVRPSDGSPMLLGNGNGEVFSDGTYVIISGEVADIKSANWSAGDRSPFGSIKILRSEDGGENFGSYVVSPWFKCLGGGIASHIPSIAADHTEGYFKNRLYAVWIDVRSGHCDVLLSYSTNKGETWSPPKVINDEPSRSSPSRFAEHSMPVVAVNNRGVVGVLWYDRRNSPDLGWQTRFTASLDGGETFLPSVSVSTARHSSENTKDFPIWIVSYGGANISTRIMLDQGESLGGDTAGMAADANGVFHPLWVDNRTGILQLWTTSVSVVGKVLPNGSEDLATLADVTSRVKFNFTNTKLNTETRILSFDVSLTNTSTVPLKTPIKFRLTDLSDGSGVAEIVNADNRQTRDGAVWDFSDVIQDGVLKPSERSKEKRFEFRLVDLQPFRRVKSGWISDLTNFRGKVFAQE